MAYVTRNLNSLLGSGAVPADAEDGDLLFKTDAQIGQKLHEGTAPDAWKPVGYPYLFAPTMWDDIRVPLTATKGGGIRDPDFSQFRDDGSGSTGVFAYDFDAAAEEELFFSVLIPHSYKLETNLKPHIHWATKTATATGTVIWGLEYTLAILDDAFPVSTIITATYTFTGDMQYDHLVTELPDISGSGVLTDIASILTCRVFRDATSDTYADDVSLLEIDFHFEMDSVGSADDFTK